MTNQISNPDLTFLFRAVRKIDKTFDQEHFVKFLEKEMIPIVLEAKAINDTEVIEVNRIHPKSEVLKGYLGLVFRFASAKVLDSSPRARKR